MMRGIRTLGVVQDALLGALKWNERVQKKVGMLSRPEERLSWRKRFGGLMGFEVWEERVQASAFPASPGEDPGSREGECEGAESPCSRPRLKAGDADKRRPAFRLARIRPLNIPNPSAKSPRLTRGLPREAVRAEKHDGGPASWRGNLRGYQIEVWPVELMWREERRRRNSQMACGRRRERSSRGMRMARARRAAARQSATAAARGRNDQKKYAEVRARGSPLYAA